MTSLFISYSRKDTEAARRLTEAFKTRQWEFWIDWEGIPPTVDWWKEIEKGIEQAGIFLFLISPNSAGSKVCRQELEHAVNTGKRLIPLVIRDVSAEEAPSELSHLNWIFFRDGDDFDLAFEKLSTAIQTDYEWVQAQRELQVKALEWQRSGKENSLLLLGKELQGAEYQLATNSSKEPHPTDLQREYVHISRRAEDRRRAKNIWIGIAGAIALAALAIFGLVQAKLATDRAEIALARQLAAQARLIDISKRHLAIRSALLAVESERRFPSLESNQAMLYALSGLSAGPLEIHPGGEVWTGQFSPDGSKFITLGGQGSVHVWDAATGDETFPVPVSDPRESMFLDSFLYPWVVSREGIEMRIIDPFSGSEVSHWDVRDGFLAAMSADGKLGLVTDLDALTVWDLEQRKSLFKIPNADYYRFHFSPDGTKLLTFQSDHTQVWDIRRGTKLTEFPSGVQAFAFSTDGSKLLVGEGFYGKAVIIWDFPAAAQIFRAEHADWITGVAFSPDEKRVISSSVDGTAVVWDVETGERISTMQHDGFVHSVAFSPDGEWVISGGDTTARIWNPEDGHEVSRVTVSEGVDWVTFSPDGRRGASGGCGQRDQNGCTQGSILIWEWQSADLVQEICQRVPYNLARLQEWKFYLGDEPYRETCPGLPVLETLPTSTSTPVPPPPASTETSTPFPIGAAPSLPLPTATQIGQ